MLTGLRKRSILDYSLGIDTENGANHEEIISPPLAGIEMIVNFMSRNLVRFLLIIALSSLGGCSVFIPIEFRCTPFPLPLLAKTLRVIDGDTIVVKLIDSGLVMHVRYRSIDAPELRGNSSEGACPECFAEEAKARNEELVGEKTVWLQYDEHDQWDKYHRLLAYVFLDCERTKMVNERLVREGFATVFRGAGKDKYREKLEAAEREARAAKRGLWGKCLLSSTLTLEASNREPWRDRLFLLAGLTSHLGG